MEKPKNILIDSVSSAINKVNDDIEILKKIGDKIKDKTKK